MHKHTLSLEWSHGHSGIVGGRVEVAGEREDNLDVEIPAGAADFEIHLALDLPKLKSFFAVSDRTLAAKVDSVEAPEQELIFPAGQPAAWFADGPLPCPFDQNVERLFVSNPGPESAVLRIRVLKDA